MRQFSAIPFAEDVALSVQARATFDTLLAGSGMVPDDLLWIIT